MTRETQVAIDIPGMITEFEANKKEAKRILDLPKQIFESIRQGETTGSPLTDMVIVRNESYDHDLVSKYRDLEKELLMADMGDLVAIRVSDVTRGNLGQTYAAGHTYSLGRLSTSQVEVDLEQGEFSIGTNGYVTWRPSYGDWHYSVREGTMPVKDYAKALLPEPFASTLDRRLYTKTTNGQTGEVITNIFIGNKAVERHKNKLIGCQGAQEILSPHQPVPVLSK
jgi:hypothetical protein